MHLWIPSNLTNATASAYVQDNSYAFTEGQWLSPLTPVAWNTLTVTVPSDATHPLSSMGVIVVTDAATPTTIYLDGVSWQ